jgi:hypothetical protein
MFMASKLKGKKDAVGLMPEVQAEWNRLSAQEKKTFEERAEADIKSFTTNVSKYMKH